MTNKVKKSKYQIPIPASFEFEISAIKFIFRQLADRTGFGITRRMTGMPPLVHLFLSFGVYFTWFRQHSHVYYPPNYSVHWSPLYLQAQTIQYFEKFIALFADYNLSQKQCCFGPDKSGRF